MDATPLVAVDYSKNLVTVFIALILIPSIFYRFAFERKYSLKERKLTLQDNAIFFFIPPAIVLFFVNGVFLKIPCFKISSLRIPTQDFLKLEFLSTSEYFRKFLYWYLAIVIFNLIAGYFIGWFAHYQLSKQRPVKLGNSFRDRTWEEIFKILNDSKNGSELYVKSKEGDIYKGILEHYSFDSNNKLELITLKRTIRIIEKKDCKSCNNPLENKVKLNDGLMIIPESNIANIWFRSSLYIVSETLTDDELTAFVKGGNFQKS